MRETPGASAAAWATPSARPSTGGRFAAAAQLLAAVGDQHQRRAGEQAEGGRPRPAEPLLDLPLEAVADRRRRSEGERQQRAPGGGRSCAAPRRSAAAGRSAAPPRRRCGARPRSSCAPPGRSPPSPSPRSQGTRTMWAELETGSSSAGPWTKPSAIARRAGSRPPLKRPGSPPGRRARRIAAAPLVEPVDDQRDDRRDDDVVEDREVFAPLFPFVPDRPAEQSEADHPGDRAERGQPGEAPEGHFRQPGGQRDEGADQRDHAGRRRR